MSILDKVFRRKDVGVSSPEALAVFSGGANSRNIAPSRTTGEFLQAYSSMPWLRAATAKISHSVAATPWKVYAIKSKATGKYVRAKAIQRADFDFRAKMIKNAKYSGELDEILDHPILDLLDASNAFLTGIETRQLTAAYIDLVGETFWLLEREGLLGTPIRAWIVPPSWVKKIPTTDRPYYEISVNGEVREVPITEMISFKTPNPVNPYLRGTGLAQAIGDELDTDEFAAKYIKQWFYNGATPPILITPAEGQVDPAEFKRLEQSWLNKLQGFWKSNKPFFSSRKVEVHELNSTFQEMQLVELRKHERDVIIQTFGVPPELLGILTNSNRATIDAADYIMSRYVVLPRLEYIRAVLQERLVPLFDDRIIIDYESPIKEDKAFQLQVFKSAGWAFTQDEWRELACEEPIDDEAEGEIKMKPQGLTPFRGYSDLADNPPQPPVSTPGTSGNDPNALDVSGVNDSTDSETGNQSTAFIPAALRALYGEENLAYLTNTTKSSPEDAAAGFLRVANVESEEIQRRLQDMIQRFRDIMNMEALEDALRAGLTEVALASINLDDLATMMGTTREDVERLVHTAGSLTAAELAKQLGVTVSFNIVNPASTAYARTASAALVKQITEQQRDSLRRIIADSIEKGIPPRQAAKLIREVVGLTDKQMSSVQRFRKKLEDAGVEGDKLDTRTQRYADSQLKKRAETIARTEVMAAMNTGRQMMWDQAAYDGLIRRDKTFKRWLTAHDDRLDEVICEPMPYLDENLKVRLSGQFTTGDGDKLAQPPAHPRCRCTTYLEFED